MKHEILYVSNIDMNGLCPCFDCHRQRERDLDTYVNEQRIWLLKLRAFSTVLNFTTMRQGVIAELLANETSIDC